MPHHLACLPSSLLVSSLLAASAVAGQQGAPVLGGASPPAARDSVRTLRAAQAEQGRFERLRRNRLPWTEPEGSGPCDERIGRFCLSYGDDEDDWQAPPEPAEVVAARDRLIARLDDAARRFPGDPWVAGQRVRYLVEAKRMEEAQAAADECAATRWWCAALTGFARHYAGRELPADSAFSLALEEMPARERRRWTDLSLLLEGPALSAYQRLEGADRERFEARFWRLADPFYVEPGNAIRSEHLARNVWDQLQDRARSAEGISWGSDLREILLRYGWPSGWERVRQRPGSLSETSIRTHYPATELELPPASLLADTADIAGGEWAEESHHARTGYLIPDTKLFKRLDFQLAVFRRGDSALVVTAYGLPADSLQAASPVRAALVLTRGDTATPVIRRDSSQGPAGALAASVAPSGYLLSLELVAPTEGRAAMVRRGLALRPWPAGETALSDLLLLRSPELLPDSLAPAMANARTSTRVVPGEQLGVYWELYGLTPQEQSPQLTFTLRLLAERSGWLRRMAERAGLVEEMAPVRVGWQEPASAAPFFARALAVQIPPELKPGSYTLELTATIPGPAGVSEHRSTRAIEVTR